MPTLRQMLSFGPGIYRGKPITATDLKNYVEGTNKAIAAGLQIPLLRYHAPINADDKTTEDFAKKEGAGFVKRVFMDDNTFNVGFEADGVPSEVLKRVQEKTDRFSSPEFRRNYKCEKEGVYCGPIIRHFAITPKPGNPDQTPLEVMALAEEEGVYQFDESDKEADLPKTEEEKCECGGTIEDGKCASCGKVVEKVEDAPADDSQHAEHHANDQPRDENGQFVEVAYYGHDSEGAEDRFDSHVTRLGGKRRHKSAWKIPADKEESLHKALAGEFQKGRHYETGSSQHAEENVDGFGKPENDEPDPENQPNPDAPPKATDKSKTKAILSGLAQKNIILPSDFDFGADGAEDILIAAINSSIAAENSVESEKEEVEPDPADNVMEAAMPFSEQELSEMSPKVRKAFETQQEALRKEREQREEAERKAQQYAEQELATKNETARKDALSKIDALKLPPALKQKLRESYEGETAIQFSEGSEQPTFTGVQVAEMVAATLPPALQFLEKAVSEANAPVASKIKGRKPDGSFDFSTPTAEQFFEQGDTPPGHMDPKTAEAIARELVGPPVNKSIPTIGDRVAAENQRVPNRVMNS